MAALSVRTSLRATCRPNLDPRLAAGYVGSGNVWQFKEEYDKALSDYIEAIRFDAEMASAYDNRAWLWATCPDPRLRDGK